MTVARKPAQDTLLFSLEILRRIPNHGSVSAQELHQQLQGRGFNQTIRSVQRQLDNFSKDSRIGIKQNKDSKPYGYSLGLQRKQAYHLLESKLAKDQTVEEVNDCYRIESTAVRSLLLTKWLRGFGEDVWGVEMG